MIIKYAPMKDVKHTINQDVIRDVMTNGRKICQIYYKVIDGFLIMVSSGSVVKREIDKTIEIIQQLMKDSKRKYNFNGQFIFTYSIPVLVDVVA